MTELKTNEDEPMEVQPEVPPDITRVIVLGAGGVGFWQALALLRDLPEWVKITVIDGDNFEGGNGHLRLPKVSNPQTSKVNFLRGFAAAAMGLRTPDVIPMYLEPDNLDALELGPADLLIDCTDMALEVRKPLWQVFRELGVRLLRVSYDGNGIVVVARGLPLSGRPEGGYSLVPNQSQSFAAAGLGAGAALRILQGKEVGDAEYQL